MNVIFADEAYVQSFVSKVAGLELVPLGFHGALLVVARSARGNTASSVVISSHFDSPLSLPEKNVTGALVALKLAELLASSPRSFGRDVLFLFSHRTEGVASLERFLRMYYHDKDDGGSARFRRSGPLQQGFHLDFSFKNGARKMVVEVEGQRLPNLDMVNNLVRCASSKGCGVSCSCSFSSNLQKKGVAARLIVTTRKFFFRFLAQLPPRIAFFSQFFLSQALGEKTIHSVLNEWACDTVTVASVGEGNDISLYSFADTIEAAFRSVLSLQENLHQSFYFYLLPSPWLYVPIGDYMIVFALCFLVFPLSVAWFGLYSAAGNLSFDDGLLELELFAPLLLGVFVWCIRQFEQGVVLGCYELAVLVALFLPQRGKDVSSSLRDGLVFVGTTYWSLMLVLCVLVNFSLAIIGCVMGFLLLFAWRLNSRVLFVLVDPFVPLFFFYGSNVPSLIAYVPFRFVCCKKENYLFSFVFFVSKKDCGLRGLFFIPIPSNPKLLERLVDALCNRVRRNSLNEKHLSKTTLELLPLKYPCCFEHEKLAFKENNTSKSINLMSA